VWEEGNTAVSELLVHRKGRAASGEEEERCFRLTRFADNPHECTGRTRLRSSLIEAVSEGRGGSHKLVVEVETALARLILHERSVEDRSEPEGRES
jgi:hypothetical protein